MGGEEDAGCQILEKLVRCVVRVWCWNLCGASDKVDSGCRVVWPRPLGRSASPRKSRIGFRVWGQGGVAPARCLSLA